MEKDYDSSMIFKAGFGIDINRGGTNTNDKGRPREALRSLGLPNQIVQFLLFNDLDVNVILKEKMSTTTLLRFAC